VHFSVIFGYGDDLQDLQNFDEGTEGAHLPQDAQMEMPEVRAG
jgi:hypothetical protein